LEVENGARTDVGSSGKRSRQRLMASSAFSVLSVTSSKRCRHLPEHRCGVDVLRRGAAYDGHNLFFFEYS
jgi:hypothetical protein